VCTITHTDWQVLCVDVTFGFEYVYIHQYAGPESVTDVITEWLMFSNKWFLNSTR
jgi:hypothetical protein